MWLGQVVVPVHRVVSAVVALNDELYVSPGQTVDKTRGDNATAAVASHDIVLKWGLNNTAQSDSPETCLLIVLSVDVQAQEASKRAVDDWLQDEQSVGDVFVRDLREGADARVAGVISNTISVQTALIVRSSVADKVL